MLPTQKRKFGRTDLNVTAFGFGTAPLGNFLAEMDEATATAMFDTAWDAGIRMFDTAPMYGHGLSEARTAQALRWKNRDDFVLASKVGRLLRPARRADIDFAPWVNAAPFTLQFDYSYDGTMRAFEDSLQRLALEHIDISSSTTSTCSPVAPNSQRCSNKRWTAATARWPACAIRGW